MKLGRIVLIVVVSLLVLIIARGFIISDNDLLFSSLVKPFVSEAQRRRDERAKSDPQSVQRVDRALNVDRINFVLFGYGETHEPPMTERAIIGSFTIISYNTRTSSIDLISMTHDIRAPEVERAMATRNAQTHALKMDRAYDTGGFPLMREMLEDATGLSIDFQIAFKDTAIQRVVDQVFDGIEVDVPTAFAVQPFYLDGEKYPAGFFSQGKQKLNGRQVIQYIKTVPVAEAEYDKSLEHNARKHLIFMGLLHALNEQSADRAFWLRLMGFVRDEIGAGNAVLDFDPFSLVVNNVGAMLPGIEKLIQRRALGIRLPAIDRAIYIVDPAHGDGGVQWVNANAPENPLTQQDIDAGVYPNLDYEVPINANPYGDLATEYWTSVRTRVSKALSGQDMIENNQEPE
ncbi:hypothetical protein ANRL1_00381 [Anaerolineae bacterium]|nr:hypothetical protein ANRL1_00381 [Anaerolineae bacterium]